MMNEHTEIATPEHSEAKSETERPQALKASKACKYAIRSDRAKAEGWQNSEAAEEPTKCKYCGKTLYHWGIKSPMGFKTVISWNKRPERCTCEGAVKYWREQDKLKAAAEEAEKRKEAERHMQQRISKLLKDSGMRGRFASRTFEHFEVNETNRRAYEKCKQYAENFSDMLPTKDKNGVVNLPKKERNGLFITGSYGTGKTHLAAAIANSLIADYTAVICMTMIDLLARIKNSFEAEETATEAEILKLYEEIPLLIIDDIGSEQPTEWGLTKIYQIINARYEAYMPVVITTNYSAKELIQRITPSRSGNPGDTRNAEKTIDRLQEMCVGIEMRWESWRGK